METPRGFPCHPALWLRRDELASANAFERESWHFRAPLVRFESSTEAVAGDHVPDQIGQFEVTGPHVVGQMGDEPLLALVEAGVPAGELIDPLDDAGVERRRSEHGLGQAAGTAELGRGVVRIQHAVAADLTASARL